MFSIIGYYFCQSCVFCLEHLLAFINSVCQFCSLGLFGHHLLCGSFQDSPNKIKNGDHSTFATIYGMLNYSRDDVVFSCFCETEWLEEHRPCFIYLSFFNFSSLLPGQCLSVVGVPAFIEWSGFASIQSIKKKSCICQEVILPHSEHPS